MPRASITQKSPKAAAPAAVPTDAGTAAAAAALLDPPPSYDTFSRSPPALHSTPSSASTVASSAGPAAALRPPLAVHPHHYLAVGQDDTDDEIDDDVETASARMARLAGKSPFTDCTRAAACPITVFLVTAALLFGLMWVYPRLLGIYVNSVRVDPTRFPPVEFSLSPPSVTVHLLANVTVTNPLVIDLDQYHLAVAASYPHFDPPVAIGHSTLNATLALPARSQHTLEMPFALRLPDDSGAPAPAPGAPGLADLVLAVADDCRTRGWLILDLHWTATATSWWWHYGGAVHDVHSVEVPCGPLGRNGTATSHR
ncbi:hypothetical protein AMAG_02527 [Allomyces macrogynus ATCC 38327]|uniref:Uncharacterized protein n=1 Tax=Allomyces macrogynus (strain ATCC 38327) TaxID=578462 RepID=A0A0L0S2H7_ALLM3|nr:hypothetical protein, variant [Allomyces macrogynus ATCC 38327]KNE56748.1 hypothetical protein AMAG_02527 [Allomyces macrogynus ATCC 38327]|eukprot:KNE56747.1 hypothetical protein, variant [Allomyces macrogynus ATCC 38327]